MNRWGSNVLLREWRTGYEVDHSIWFVPNPKDWRFGRWSKSTLSCDRVRWGFGPVIYYKVDWVPD